MSTLDRIPIDVKALRKTSQLDEETWLSGSANLDDSSKSSSQGEANNVDEWLKVLPMISILRSNWKLPKLWNSFESCCCLADFSLLKGYQCEIQQRRGRKRCLRAPLSKQQKMERRLKREAKEAERKKYSFMERIHIRRMKRMLSPSEQFPGRLDREKEAELPDHPTTNIFIRSSFKTQFYSIAEALSMHREMQIPAIYNNPSAPIRLRIELNMTTERQTKLLSNSDEIVPVPHTFHHKEKRTILAFAQDPIQQQIAVESGAEIALGPEMIKKIIKGQFRTDDYDFCVSHSDMGGTILPLRGILKTRFPTKLNGGYGDNLPEMIENFKNGVKVNIRSDPVYPIWGLCDCVAGRLDMADVEVEENVAAIIRAICAHRNPALGPFINRLLLMVIPGTAHFAINIDKYVPVATEEQVEKLEKRQSRKKKKDTTKIDSEEASGNVAEISA